MNDPAGPPDPAAAPLPVSPNEAARTEPTPPASAPADPPGPPEPLAAVSVPQDPAVAAQLKARSRDKRIGMGVVAGAFIVGLGISYWAKHASRPETSEPPGPPTREGVKGYPDRVDVVASLDAARKLTRRMNLRGFVVDGVKSDGSIDLSEGPGRARYAFQSPPGHGPQPITEAGMPYRQPFCGRQDVWLRHEGLVADPDQATVPCTPKASEPLPDPRCTLATIWQRAIQRGVPSDRLARIEYYRANGGPAWRFEVPEGSHRFVLYGDCQSELKGSAASGHVP